MCLPNDETANYQHSPSLCYVNIDVEIRGKNQSVNVANLQRENFSEQLKFSDRFEFRNERRFKSDNIIGGRTREILEPVFKEIFKFLS